VGEGLGGGVWGADIGGISWKACGHEY